MRLPFSLFFFFPSQSSGLVTQSLHFRLSRSTCPPRVFYPFIYGKSLRDFPHLLAFLPGSAPTLARLKTDHGERAVLRTLHAVSLLSLSLHRQRAHYRHPCSFCIGMAPSLLTSGNKFYFQLNYRKPKKAVQKIVFPLYLSQNIGAMYLFCLAKFKPAVK